jgi:hypothetical protein
MTKPTDQVGGLSLCTMPGCTNRLLWFEHHVEIDRDTACLNALFELCVRHGSDVAAALLDRPVSADRYPDDG